MAKRIQYSNKRKKEREPSAIQYANISVDYHYWFKTSLVVV